MTTTIEKRELAGEMVEMQELTAASETATEATASQELVHTQLPWIGALTNPQLGPLVVINNDGYLIPLFTAGDLLRGCRYLWRPSRAELGIHRAAYARGG
jgi:hypothetical protein